MSPTSPLERQVRRVRRRLFLQTLLDALAWCWAGALLLSAGWFLLEPYLVPDAASWLRWAVAGGALGLGAVLAVLAAWWRAPSRLAAALALDQRYNLKERVTTSLGLTGSEFESAAGRALVADVNNRLMPLRVGERFPVRLHRSAAAVPAAVLLLVLLAVFYRPGPGTIRANDGNRPLTDDPAQRQAIDDAKKDLLKPPDNKKAEQKPRDPNLQKLDEDVAELAHQETDTKEQAAKFVKDAAKAEDAVREAEKQLAARGDALRDRLGQEDRLNNPERLKRKQNDPAKNLRDKMQDGDLKGAADELQRLGAMLDPEQQKRIADKLDKLKDKLGDRGLNDEERKRLQEEFNKLKDELLTDELKKDIQEALNDLEKALDALAEPEKREKELGNKLDEQRKKAEEDAKKREEEVKKAEEKAKEMEKKRDEAKDPEEKKKAEEQAKKAQEDARNQREQDQAERRKSEREMEQMRRELEEMKRNNEKIDQDMKQELKDLAKELGECDKAMKDGKDGEASKRLQEAREKLRRMTGDADRQRLLAQIQRLQAARQAVCQAMNGQGNKGDEGQGNGPGDDARGGGVASGRRALGKDEETKFHDVAAAPDSGKGKMRVTDFLNGDGGERGARGPVQLTDEMRIQAAQEGASALTRQRLERQSDTDRVRGYFDAMRGPEKPAPKK
jgi:hypothetical protein